MKIKRYFAADIRQAIRCVREEQGPDAVILSNRRVDGGVEIVAAVDYDESLFEEQSSTPVKPSAPKVTPVPYQNTPTDVDDRFRDDEYHPSNPATKIAERSAVMKHTNRERVVPAQNTAARRQKSDVVQQNHPPQMEWSQDPVLVGMKNELSELRGLVEQQLSGFAWGNMARRHPMHARLMRRLMVLGLSAQESQRIAMAVNEKQSFDQAWRLALTIMEQSLTITADDILRDGGVVALVGPTGVGKTTAIAKLAARYTLRHGADQVALITTDNYRIGAKSSCAPLGRFSVPRSMWPKTTRCSSRPLNHWVTRRWY